MIPMNYKKIIIFICFLYCLMPVPRHASAEMYKYTDKNGVESYTDSLQAVPERYRKNAVKVEPGREKDEVSRSVTAEKKESSKVPSKVPEAGSKVRKAVEDFRETEYLRHAGVAAAFIGLIALIHAINKSRLSGLTGAVIKMALALCFVLGVFYVYSREVSELFDSYILKTDTFQSKAGKK